MQEMLGVTGRHCRHGTFRHGSAGYDGRFSGATHGFMIAHVAPEAYNGGPIAAVHEGDTITIDRGRRDRSGDRPGGIGEASAEWKAPAPHLHHGRFAKYWKLVSSASEGP